MALETNDKIVISVLAVLAVSMIPGAKVRQLAAVGGLHGLFVWMATLADALRKNGLGLHILVLIPLPISIVMGILFPRFCLYAIPLTATWSALTTAGEVIIKKVAVAVAASTTKPAATATGEAAKALTTPDFAVLIGSIVAAIVLTVVSHFFFEWSIIIFSSLSCGLTILNIYINYTEKKDDLKDIPLYMLPITLLLVPAIVGAIQKFALNADEEIPWRESYMSCCYGSADDDANENKEDVEVDLEKAKVVD